MKVKILLSLVLLILLIVGCDSSDIDDKEIITINGVEYSELDKLEDGFQIGKVNDDSEFNYILNSQDEVIYKGHFEFKDIIKHNDLNHFVLNVDGLDGVIDELGEVVYPFVIYHRLDNEIYVTSESDYIPYQSNSTQWGYVDRTNGETVIEPQFYSVTPFKDGVAEVTHKEAIPFEVAMDFADKNTMTLEDYQYTTYLIDEYNNRVSEISTKIESGF